MAYTPTEWVTGDVITAEKLNKAEQGIAEASALIIQGVYDESTSTSTIQETFANIRNALKIKPVFVSFIYDDGDSVHLYQVINAEPGSNNGPYLVSLQQVSSVGSPTTAYIANTPDAFPQLAENPE